MAGHIPIGCLILEKDNKKEVLQFQFTLGYSIGINKSAIFEKIKTIESF